MGFARVLGSEPSSKSQVKLMRPSPSMSYEPALEKWIDMLVHRSAGSSCIDISATGGWFLGSMMAVVVALWVSRPSVTHRVTV